MFVENTLIICLFANNFALVLERAFALYFSTLKRYLYFLSWLALLLMRSHCISLLHWWPHLFLLAAFKILSSVFHSFATMFFQMNLIYLSDWHRLYFLFCRFLIWKISSINWNIAFHSLFWVCSCRKLTNT